MKRTLLIIATCLGLCGALGAPLLAAPDAGSETPGATTAAPEQPETAPSEAPEAPTEAPSIVEEAEDLVEAYKDLKNREDEVSLRMAIAGFVAAVVSLLIAGLRRFEWVDKRKRWIPLTLAILSAAAAVTDHLATGSGFIAAITGATGALSIAFHQTVKQFRKG